MLTSAGSPSWPTSSYWFTSSSLLSSTAFCSCFSAYLAALLFLAPVAAGPRSSQSTWAPAEVAGARVGALTSFNDWAATDGVGALPEAGNFASDIFCASASCSACCLALFLPDFGEAFRPAFVFLPAGAGVGPSRSFGSGLGCSGSAPAFCLHFLLLYGLFWLSWPTGCPAPCMRSSSSASGLKLCNSLSK